LLTPSFIKIYSYFYTYILYLIVRSKILTCYCPSRSVQFLFFAYEGNRSD